jgi:hypothetical protein
MQGTGASRPYQVSFNGPGKADIFQGIKTTLESNIGKPNIDRKAIGNLFRNGLSQIIDMKAGSGRHVTVACQELTRTLLENIHKLPTADQKHILTLIKTINDTEGSWPGTSITQSLSLKGKLLNAPNQILFQTKDLDATTKQTLEKSEKRTAIARATAEAAKIDTQAMADLQRRLDALKT